MVKESPVLLAGEQLRGVAAKASAALAARDDPALLAAGEAFLRQLLDPGPFAGEYGVLPLKRFDEGEGFGYSAEEREVLAVITAVLLKHAPGTVQFEVFAAELFTSLRTSSALQWQARAELSDKSEWEDAAATLCSRLIHPSGRGDGPKLDGYDASRRFDNWLFAVAKNFFRDFADAQRRRAGRQTSIDADETEQLAPWLSTRADATHEAALLQNMLDDEAVAALFFDSFAQAHADNLALYAYLACLRQCGMRRMDAWKLAQEKLQFLYEGAKRNSHAQEPPDPAGYRLSAHHRETYYFWLYDALVDHAVSAMGYDASLAVKHLKYRPERLPFEPEVRLKLQTHCDRAREEEAI